MSNIQKFKGKFRFGPYNLRKLSKSLNSIPEGTGSERNLDLSITSDPSSSNLLNDSTSLTIMTNDNNDGVQPPQTSQVINQVVNQVEIFNSLRIPDAIKDLPKFDGNPRLLYEFLNNVEEILLYIRGTDKTPYGQILLRAIRNKIEGQANEILNMYGTPLIWDEIKNNLILHYSDKRTETSLIRDLHNIKQFNKTIESLYGEIIELQSALCNNIQIQETDTNVIKAKKDLYAEMCLNSFLTCLNEPLGSRVRAMQPDTLATALACCIKEQNISYQRFSQNHSPHKPNHYKPYNPQQSRTYPKYQNPNPFRPNLGAPQYRENQPRPSFKYSPFNKTNFNTQGNRYQKPEPIANFRNNTDLIRRIPNIKTSQTQQIRNFKGQNSNYQEMNNIDNNNYQQLDRFFENDETNVCDEENFSTTASKNQQGT